MCSGCSASVWQDEEFWGRWCWARSSVGRRSGGFSALPARSDCWVSSLIKVINLVALFGSPPKCLSPFREERGLLSVLNVWLRLGQVRMVFWVGSLCPLQSLLRHVRHEQGTSKHHLSSSAQAGLRHWKGLSSTLPLWPSGLPPDPHLLTDGNHQLGEGCWGKDLKGLSGCSWGSRRG